MKTILLSVFVLSLVITGCKNKQNVAAVSEADSSKKEMQKKQKDMFFSLRRTACYGTCPVFEVKIFEDGSATYKGERYVEKEGKYIARLSQQDMNEIKEKAKTIGFFDLEDKYDSPITDLPSAIVELHVDGKVKRIEARADVPSKLRGFLNEMDRLIDRQGWSRAPHQEE